MTLLQGGAPDFGTIHVRYIPDALCLELKSVKFYLWSFRNDGIFYERAVNRILDDLAAVREAALDGGRGRLQRARRHQVGDHRAARQAPGIVPLQRTLTCRIMPCAMCERPSRTLGLKQRSRYSPGVKSTDTNARWSGRIVATPPSCFAGRRTALRVEPGEEILERLPRIETHEGDLVRLRARVQEEEGVAAGCDRRRSGESEIDRR